MPWTINFTIPLAIIITIIIAIMIAVFLAYRINRWYSGSLKKPSTETLPEPRKLLTYERSATEEEPVRTDAMEILKIRYAEGEITREQYRKMKKELETLT